MFPKPSASIKSNTYEFETKPLVKPTGFREYDARWLFGEELNLMGVQALGAGIGTVLHKLGVEPSIIVGHDFRGYSASIKMALITGLMSAGCKVKDIGLALSPMAYYAQFALDCPAVAMVTASHNENGWTGVKMGANRPLTFGPDEMAMLRDVVLNGQQEIREGGGLEIVEDFAKSYMDDLANRPKLKNKLKVVAACGNGTAGAFAPHVLKAIGCEVIEMDCDLDHSFPNYNPNPEDLKMLHALRDRVLETGADVGLAFDGDGDRCGVVDEKGNEIFADKVGVMLARDISAIHDNKQFVVDVKSTGLFKTDPVLNANGAVTDYFKTGHSYIKRRVTDLNAIVGFEKSGHFFFNAPIGRGYDDGILSALAVCDMLDRNSDKSMSDLYSDLPKTYGSPTMSAKCADEIKYEVVDRVVAKLSGMVEAGESLGGQKLIDAVTVNGIRVTVEDGTWGLVRASSNKPEIVVVIESPASQQRLEEMFEAVDAVLRENPEVGVYNQTLKG
ncbi:phosphomannomutase/phosphoglucomutase [Cohaesibacter gelatinilyticus]|uniref:Phosphomannomutase / phosphoglucomutase n=1 Tax=Cohaesibacter gelatinilyticus TaxID=372072 RepID=A0A285PG61_9HYPH|nr:phosphomannomutase/phosphoglucomutase [Cohaesibacter gelatinilyticus]SNZ20702.1 phosphomannomutase / phosphoglucomutase [Cohaesibacter gelatinilyticus]